MGRILHGAVLLLPVLMASVAAAQDIPGLEACTAEKQMDRRTGCLHSNDDFLQQTLQKLARDTRVRFAASERDLAAARAEIATLKSAIETLKGERAQMKAKLERTGTK